MSQDLQLQNTMRERSAFLEHMRSILTRILQNQRNEENPRVRLMKELCTLIQSDPNQVASALIPSTRAQIMEDYLCAKNIPHAQIKAQNGMTMFVFDSSKTAEINLFDRQCMKLGHGGQKIASTHDMIDIFRATNNKVMATFAIEGMPEAQVETILSKLYAGGKGYGVCKTNGYVGLTPEGNPIGRTMLGMEISAVCNSDINQPDLVQACVETAVTAQNKGKLFIKELNDKIDNKALSEFASNISIGEESCYLCDRYNSTKSFFEYNAKDNCVYKHDYITGDKVRVLDKQDIDEARRAALAKNQTLAEALEVRLAGIGDQVRNMVVVSPEVKAEFDLKTKDEIALERTQNLNENGKRIYDILAKAEASNKGPNLADLNDIPVHIDYNDKAFLSGISDRIKECGKVPDMVRDMVALNATEDLAATLVSNYMTEHLTVSLDTDVAINVQEALKSLKADIKGTPNLFDRAFSKEAILANIKEHAPNLASQMKEAINEETLVKFHEAFQNSVTKLVDAIEVKEVDAFERIVNENDEIEKAVVKTERENAWKESHENAKENVSNKSEREVV